MGDYQKLVFLCGDCEYEFPLTLEEHAKLMRMTPVCPECGSTNVRGLGRIVTPPKVGGAR